MYREDSEDAEHDTGAQRDKKEAGGGEGDNGGKSARDALRGERREQAELQGRKTFTCERIGAHRHCRVWRSGQLETNHGKSRKHTHRQGKRTWRNTE